MALEHTWRWFGPKDPISLREIKQTGAEGIVTALHHIPTGEVWSVDEIMKRRNMMEAEGLRWSVAESLAVHEDIKKRTGRYMHYLKNYAESIRNLGECGIDVVCYNFMPVLDWSRTALDVVFRDGSITSRFEACAFAAFDVFILERPGAELAYSEDVIKNARHFYDGLSPELRHKLVRTVLLGFPGSGECFTLEGLRKALTAYRNIGENELRDNLHSFLREIVPVAEESGVLMAIHPDDPPWPLLGLPRVVSSGHDVERLLAVHDSPSNGLTLCTGSFGASRNNDLVAMAEQFARRITFIHLRNVGWDGEGGFLEENHLEGDIDIYGVMRTILLEQERRKKEGRKDTRMPMRPDHGHLMLADRYWQNVYPGYSLFGRMRALAELRGLEAGISRSLGLEEAGA
jgi:mannonate dehydratase